MSFLKVFHESNQFCKCNTMQMCITIFIGDCVFQDPFPVVEIHKAFLLIIGLKSNHVPKFSFASKAVSSNSITRLWTFTSISYISRCVVEIFRSCWLIAVTWTCVQLMCQIFLFFSSVANHSSFILDDMSYASLHDVSSVLLQYHHHH